MTASLDRRGDVRRLEDLRELSRRLREAIAYWEVEAPQSLLLDGCDPERLRESLGDVEGEIWREVLRLERDAPRVDAGMELRH